MFEKVHDGIVLVLSIPLMIYHYLHHLVECVIMRHKDYKDKLFMRRFRLIDDKHVDDFLKWNDKYHDDRKRRFSYFFNNGFPEEEALHLSIIGIESVRQAREYLDIQRR